MHAQGHGQIVHQLCKIMAFDQSKNRCAQARSPCSQHGSIPYSDLALSAQILDLAEQIRVAQRVAAVLVPWCLDLLSGDSDETPD